MARITIASLNKQLDEVNASFEQAHAMLMDVSAQRDALQAQVAALEELGAMQREAVRSAHAERDQARYALDEAMAVVEAQRAPSRRLSAHMPAWQAERAASMALAREMAMRSGRTVKVSA